MARKLSKKALECLQNSTYPDLGEIIAESLGIYFEENEIDAEQYYLDGEPMDFTYKFINFDTAANFEVTFENGSVVTYSVPTWYFDIPASELPDSRNDFPEFTEKFINWALTPDGFKFITRGYNMDDEIFTKVTVLKIRKGTLTYYGYTTTGGFTGKLSFDPNKNTITDGDETVTLR